MDNDKTFVRDCSVCVCVCVCVSEQCESSPGSGCGVRVCNVCVCVCVFEFGSVKSICNAISFDTFNSYTHFNTFVQDECV